LVKALLSLWLTCFSAVAAYYLFGVRLHLSDTVSMTAGILTAFILSRLFARLRKEKEGR